MKNLIFPGQLASLANVSRSTVRRYFRAGLIKKGGQTNQGFPLYDTGTIKKLDIIWRLRLRGLSLIAIKRKFRNGNIYWG